MPCCYRCSKSLRSKPLISRCEAAMLSSHDGRSPHQPGSPPSKCQMLPATVELPWPIAERLVVSARILSIKKYAGEVPMETSKDTYQKMQFAQWRRGHTHGLRPKRSICEAPWGRGGGPAVWLASSFMIRLYDPSGNLSFLDASHAACTSPLRTESFVYTSQISVFRISWPQASQETRTPG